MAYKKKTHSGAQKRFKKTALGLVKGHHQGRRHYLTHKNRKRKRTLKASLYLSAGDQARVSRVI